MGYKEGLSSAMKKNFPEIFIKVIPRNQSDLMKIVRLFGKFIEDPFHLLGNYL